MTDSLRKYLTITNFILCFLTFSQFALNSVISQNLTNVHIAEPTVATLEEIQLDGRKQIRNDLEIKDEDHLRKEFQEESEPQLLNLPKESSKQYNPTLTSHADDEQNLAQIPKVVQLLNNGQFQNNEQLMLELKLSLTNIFPRITSNSVPFEPEDVMKALQTSSFNRTGNGLKKLTLFSNLNISMECLISLWDFRIDLKEGRLWAIRMVDSFGKIPHGMLDINRMSFGDFDMCLDTELPGKYQGKYCMVKMKRHSNQSKRVPLQPIDLSSLFDRDFSKYIHEHEGIQPFVDIPMTTSICLPSNCSKTEVQNILTEVIRYVDQPVDINVKHCYVKENFQMNQLQINILILMVILVLFEAFATILDFRLRNFYSEQFDEKKFSKAVQYTLAFSFYSNAQRIFKKTENSDLLSFFHGLRVIVQIWLILGHAVLINLITLGRFYQVFSYWTEFVFQIAQNGILGTETFFFIGGFLLMHAFIKANTSQITFVYYALRRLIRLMPPVLFTIGCLILSENLCSGPLWKLFSNFLIRPCKTNWWRNVLFINNMDEVEDICLIWSWYVSADMQLYLISYLILILMKKNLKIAVLVLKIIIIANVVGLFILYTIYELPPLPLLIYTHFLDIPYYLKMIHLRPYNHFTPYFLGMLSGYIIASEKRIILTRLRQFLGWFMAAVFASICIFTTYIWNNRARPATVIESALYGSTHRLLWSLMLLWLIYICVNGKAGIIVSILSWDVFIPFSRLTYMVYLIHPLFGSLFVGQLKFVLFADMTFTVLIAVGFLVVSYVLAFVACLICEAPFIRLTSLFFSGELQKTKAS